MIFNQSACIFPLNTTRNLLGLIYDALFSKIGTSSNVDQTQKNVEIRLKNNASLLQSYY